MVSVSDLANYLWCTRSVWLKIRLGIKSPVTAEKRVGVKFHSLVRGIYDQIEKTLALKLPGKVVATELLLPKKASIDEVLGLVGRVDVLRQTMEGYIVEDEKYSDPPKTGRIYPTHKLQLDAYTFLLEKDGYVPIQSAIIIYNDLTPREVETNPEKIPSFVNELKNIINNDVMPKAGDKCNYCSYSPLCSILPEAGGLTANEILKLKFGISTKVGYTVVARFPSKSKPGVTYNVVKDEKTGSLSCDCLGWQWKKKCWHVGAGMFIA